ncbi:GumC family protein [Aeromonas cavernicola]|uniref:Chain-length determining protein n=1 Tax=Aeromonas cavernicola TaxID=1006623 RepID=A0A2H9U371_9GAMM|nr:Wzz/FepE/Etk N-terminal domain-containing protein [Aeromonas cavernicola]PJG58483.1 chain-length determining protein [Aeromonas cavernicola]
MPSQIYYNLFLILSAAWRRRYLLLMPVLVMPFVGIAVGLLTPKEYESRTTFMVPQDSNQTPTLKDLITQESLKDRFAVLEALLRSRYVLDGVARDRGLVNDDTSPTQRDLVMDWLSAAVSIRLIGDEVIELKVRADSAENSAGLVEAVSRRFFFNLLSKGRQSAESSERFLQSQLDSRRSELQNAEELLSRFKREHANALPEQQNANIARLYTLKERYAESIIMVQQAKARFEQLSQGQENPLARQLTEKLQLMKTELSLLRARYSNGHSKIQSLVYQIEQLQQELDGLKTQPGTAIDAVWTRAKEQATEAEQNATGLQAQLDGLSKTVDSQGEVERQLAELVRDLEVKRSLYQDLLLRYEKAKVTGALGNFEPGERIKVIDKPFAPSKPSNFPLIVFLLAGIVGGIGLGCGLALLVELADTSLRRSDQLAALINAPVLSRIPYCEPSPLPESTVIGTVS